MTRRRAVFFACVAATLGPQRAIAASVEWVRDASGQWTDSANWSSHPLLPDSGDDVHISRNSGDWLVTLDSGPWTHQINSLVSDERFEVASTVRLIVAGAASFNSGLTLRGLPGQAPTLWATVRSAALSAPAVDARDASLLVTDFHVPLLTVTGPVSIGGTGFHGTLISIESGGSAYGNFGGRAEVVFNGGTTLAAQPGSQIYAPDGAWKLTIPPEVLVRTGSSGGSVGLPAARDHSVVNHGTILAGTPGRELTFAKFSTNHGTFAATDGGVLHVYDLKNGATGVTRAERGGVVVLDGPTANAGAIDVRDGGVLRLGAGFSGSAGSVTLNGGALELGTTLKTSAVRAYARQSSPVRVTGGVIDNDLDTLIVDPSQGGFELRGGELRGGAVAGTPDATLIAAPPPAWLANPPLNRLRDVVIGLPVSVAPGAKLALAGNWDNRSTIHADMGDVILESLGTRTGTVNIIDGALTLRTAASPSDLSPYQRVRSPLVVDAGTLDNAGNTFSLSGGNHLELRGGVVNGGVVRSEDQSTVFVREDLLNFGRKPSVMDGVRIESPVVAARWARLVLKGAWENHHGITASDAIIALRGTPSAVGEISALRSRVYLEFEVKTADLGGFTLEQSPLVVGHTGFRTTPVLTERPPSVLDNAGDVLLLSNGASAASSGPVFLSGGRIRGGTIRSLDGTPLIARNMDYVDGSDSARTSVLDDVELDADLNIENIQRVELHNGVNVRNRRITLLTTGAWLSLAGPDAMRGEGEVVFAGLGTHAIRGSGLVSLPVGFTVRTATGSGTLWGGAGIINHGLISAATASRSITVQLADFTNDGTVEARDGGRFVVQSAATRLKNLLAGTLAGGAWSVFAGSTLDLSGAQVTTNAAMVLLDGIGSRFDAINPLRVNRGSFSLGGGRDFTTGDAFTNDGTLSIDVGSDLNVTGDFDQGPEALLKVILGPADDAEAYGQVRSTGAAILGGALHADLALGYEPARGEQFMLVIADSINGGFATVTLPELPDGLTWELDYAPTTVMLTVVPEPSMLTGALLAASGWLARRRAGRPAVRRASSRT